MGLYSVPCAVCGTSFMWFSGNTGDQRCEGCKAQTVITVSVPEPSPMVNIQRLAEALGVKAPRKDKRLYNYVVNTLGLTKEMIMSYVDQRIASVVEKHIEGKLNSNYVEKLILNRVTQIVEAGFNATPTNFYKREAFDDYVRKSIERILEKKFRDEYTIEMKATNKKNSVIQKT